MIKKKESTSLNLPQVTRITATRRGLIGVLRTERNVKCFILTGLLLGALSALVSCRLTTITKIDINYDAFPITRERTTPACQELSFLLPASFVLMLYGLYLVECYHSSTWSILRKDKLRVDEVHSLLDTLRTSTPRIWWKSKSYHIVRRLRTISRTHQGHKIPGTQIFHERVTSSLAQTSFYTGCCGVVDTTPILSGLDSLLATRIRLSSNFLFAGKEALSEFEEQRSTFFQDQGRLDTYLEMREGFELLPRSGGRLRRPIYHGGSEEIVAWGSPKSLLGSRPLFWVTSLLLLSWPWRLLLNLNTAHCNLQVTKLFGSNYIMRPPPPRSTPVTPPQSLSLGRRDFLLEKDSSLPTPVSALPRSVTLLKIQSPDGQDTWILAPSYSQALLWSNLCLDGDIECQSSSSLAPLPPPPSYEQATLPQTAPPSSSPSYPATLGTQL